MRRRTGGRQGLGECAHVTWRAPQAVTRWTTHHASCQGKAVTQSCAGRYVPTRLFVDVAPTAPNAYLGLRSLDAPCRINFWLAMSLPHCLPKVDAHNQVACVGASKGRVIICWVAFGTDPGMVHSSQRRCLPAVTADADLRYLPPTYPYRPYLSAFPPGLGYLGLWC